MNRSAEEHAEEMLEMLYHVAAAVNQSHFAAAAYIAGTLRQFVMTVGAGRRLSALAGDLCRDTEGLYTERTRDTGEALGTIRDMVDLLGG